MIRRKFTADDISADSTSKLLVNRYEYYDTETGESGIITTPSAIVEDWNSFLVYYSPYDEQYCYLEITRLSDNPIDWGIKVYSYVNPQESDEREVVLTIPLVEDDSWWPTPQIESEIMSVGLEGESAELLSPYAKYWWEEILSKTDQTPVEVFPGKSEVHMEAGGVTTVSLLGYRLHDFEGNEWVHVDGEEVLLIEDVDLNCLTGEGVVESTIVSTPTIIQDSENPDRWFYRYTGMGGGYLDSSDIPVPEDMSYFDKVSDKSKLTTPWSLYWLGKLQGNNNEEEMKAITIYGQAFISGGSLVQDQILLTEKSQTENTVVLISDIWEDLMSSGGQWKAGKNGYFYWEVDMTDTEDTEKTVKVKVSCPKPGPDLFDYDFEISDDDSDWTAYWKSKMKTVEDSPYNSVNAVQPKEVTLPGTKYIDQNGGTVEIKETKVTRDNLGDIQNLLLNLY